MNLEIGDTRLIIDECKRRGVLRNQAAYILATAYWETARTMKPVKEAYWLSEDWRRKNLRYFPWYGRGYVQLTWKENYIRAKEELGIDFVSDPSKAMEPEAAVEVLVLGSLAGWFTGKKLSDYITLKKSDFFNARRVINGKDKASQIAEIAKDYDKALVAEGYGVADVKGIPVPKAKPKVHKSLVSSKELGLGVGGTALVGLKMANDVSDQAAKLLDKFDSNLLLVGIGCLFVGFIANRLYARWKGER